MMSRSNNGNGLEKTTPNRMLSSKLNLVDLEILCGMLEGKSYDEIANELREKGYTIADTKSKLMARLKCLEEKRVVLRRSIPLIDITKVYNHIYITLVKLHLAATVPITPPPLEGIMIQTVTPTPPPPAWSEAISEMRKSTGLFEKHVRYAYALVGTEWDVILVVSVQSVEEYSRFIEEIQRKTGMIDKVWGMRVIESADYQFNPISLPDPKEIEVALNWTREATDEALRKT